MSIAASPFRKLSIKVETSFGVFPAVATGGQYLPRVSCDLNKSRNAYDSQSIRTDQQLPPSQQGTTKVDGTIKCELAPQQLQIPMAATVRKDFIAAVTSGALTTLSLTSTGIHRSSGSFISDGFKAGMVIAQTGLLTPADAYNSKRYIIGTITASDLTLLKLDGTAAAFTTHAAGDTVTVAMVGKYTYVPSSGHTNSSYSIEEYFSDIAQSEAYLGCKFSSMDINMQPDQFASADFAVMGRNMQATTSEQFTSPTAIPSTNGLTGSRGAVIVNGTAVGLLTGFQFKTDGQMSTGATVGGSLTPDVFAGIIKGSGQLTAYFQDGTLRDYFLNATLIQITAVMVSDSTDTADFVAFTLPGVTLNSANKDDKQTGGTILTVPFSFARPVPLPTGAIDSTLMIQDSLAA